MTDLTSLYNDSPDAEAVGSTGLILFMVAVIATAMCAASVGAASMVSALLAGALALLAFAASIALLIAQGKHAESSEKTVLS